MKEPRVSLVIPAYNHSDFLEEAIESVLVQDYPQVQLIVLDDGSTDRTREVLEKYSRRFHWESHANMGQAATLNKGWEMADGDILSYLSADDALMPDAISTAVRRLTEKPETVMVYCDFYLMDCNSHIIKMARARDYDYSELVLKNMCFPGPGVFFRRKAYEAAGPWNIRLKQVPDFDFWIRLGLQGPFERIPRPLSKFRVHSGSQTCCEPDVCCSNEIIQVIAGFFENCELPSILRCRKNEALSFAGVIAARSHLRAGRYRMAFDFLLKSIRLFFPVIFSIHAMKFIGNGLMYRIGKFLSH